jgi:hypothetical protein
MSICSSLKLIEKNIMSKSFSLPFTHSSEKQIAEVSDGQTNVFVVVRSSVSNRSKLFKAKVVHPALKSLMGDRAKERAPYMLKPLPKMTYEEVTEAGNMVDDIISILESVELTAAQRQKLRGL